MGWYSNGNVSVQHKYHEIQTNLNLGIQCTLLLVELIVVVWVHLQVVESEFLLYTLLESTSLLQGQGIRLGNDRYDIDNIWELLQNHDINGLQSVAWGLNEEQAAVNASILDIPFTLSSEFLSEVCRVLILNVLDNWVPASVIVDLITITWGIDNVESQTNTILFNNMRNCLNFGGRSYWLVGCKSSFRVDQVWRKDCVNQSRLSKTSLSYSFPIRLYASHKTAEERIWEAVHTNTNDIELETTLQELALDLGCDTVETDVTAWEHRLLRSMSVHGSVGCHCVWRDRIIQELIFRALQLYVVKLTAVHRGNWEGGIFPPQN